MSTESAKMFAKKMMEDKEFAATMQKLSNGEDRAAFVRQEGFEFSKEELIDAASELNAVDVVGGHCCGQTCEWVSCHPVSCVNVNCLPI